MAGGLFAVRSWLFQSVKSDITGVFKGSGSRFQVSGAMGGRWQRHLAGAFGSMGMAVSW